MIKINTITTDKRWFKYIKNPNNFLEKKINSLNKNLSSYKKKDIFFTLLLSGGEHIKKLNRKFRKKNKTTDILSFPFHNKKELQKKLKKDKEIYLGDIIINFKKVKNNKKVDSFKLELSKLLIHGFTHLLGYDHKKNKDFTKMRKVEDKFLSYLND